MQPVAVIFTGVLNACASIVALEVGKFMKGIGTISGNATRRVAWCRTQNKRFNHSKKLAIAC